MSQATLLDIAVREFGLKGLDGASTRGIAAAAGMAMSSITYHYGGKDRLYLAAADHIAQAMAVEIAPALAAEADVAPADPAAARTALHRLMRRFVDNMADDQFAGWSLFIMREQLEPGEAFDRIYAGMMGTLLQCLADLVGVATGARAAAARLATVTLLGQALSVRGSRATVLRLLEIDSLDPATLEALKARIDANIDAMLDRMIAEDTP